jgi:ubiquinone/menaquinone biosynthesis C-methylase UbiE
MSSKSFDFAGLAKNYDLWYETPEGKMHDRAQKSTVLKLLRPAKAGERLLDVGCGTGHWSHIFADQGYEVIGIDICPEMGEVARSRDYPGCYFEIADACRLPFDNSSFEVVAAMATLEFVRDPELAVTEMFRCVKPAGSVIVGALNRLAPINRQRIADKKEPYTSARLFSPIELRYMLAPYGRLRMDASKESTNTKAKGLLNKLCGKLPTWLRQPRGSFIIGEVRR